LLLVIGGMKMRKSAAVRVVVLLVLGMGGVCLLSCRNGGEKTGPERQVIERITIRYRGEETVDRERLLNFMGTKVGMVLSEDGIDDDVRRLYESGLVEDVRFLVEDLGEGTELIVEVVTRPPMGPGLRIIGNTIFSETRLWEQSGIRTIEDINEGRLETACRRMENYYRGFGYSGVRASFRVESYEEGGAAFSDAVIVIEEGVKEGE
jgi:outer membrane protein insertion porin family